ncbi:Crp/Fnr family transcriptional regulator [Oceanobacillus manasiensis]|uniref:Crp/Fnr family transcriptional regulator n=1 Tax=Oceanobacillus manasiensis TaxID=586413 RepID=UPI0005A95917|nr:cyclic nucleotide-binding domain-containing protein [Oceanobacillus manasiensis]
MKLIQDKKFLYKTIEKYELDEIFAFQKDLPWTLQSFKSQEIILHEGRELESLLFLVEGKVKVTSSVATGKSLLLRFVQPFSIIGDIELVRDVPVQSQIKAVEESLLIGLPRDYIKKHEMDNPKFLQILLDHVTYKLQTCTTASRVNSLASVENRFASYLLSTHSADSDQPFGLELKTTNLQEIAGLLGTTYRHLNRVIQNLIQNEIIEKDKHLIQIQDWEQLEKMSNGIRYE